MSYNNNILSQCILQLPTGQTKTNTNNYTHRERQCTHYKQRDQFEYKETTNPIINDINI